MSSEFTWVDSARHFKVCSLSLRISLSAWRVLHGDVGLDAGAWCFFWLPMLWCIWFVWILMLDISSRGISFCKGQRLVGCGEFPQVAIFKAATQGTCDGYPSMDGHCHAHRNDLHWHGVMLGILWVMDLFICFLPFVSLHLLSFMLFPGAQLKIPTRVTCFSLRWLSVTYGAIMWTWSEPLTKARETWSKEVFFF